jgi:hypothetical protein
MTAKFTNSRKARRLAGKIKGRVWCLLKYSILGP